MDDTTDNKGRDTLARMQQERAERKTINAKRAQEEAAKGKPPVVPLGYMKDNQTVVYFSRVRHAVISLKPSQHKPDFLIHLAALRDWGRWLFPDNDDRWIEKNGATIWAEARERLIALARDSGRYDPTRLRKTGLWEETVDGAKGILYNAGDKCYFMPCTGGAPVEVDCIQGQRVYDADVAMAAPAAEPLSYDEGCRLLDFLSARQWAIEGSGALVLGWIVNSLLAGAVDRRPHLWVTAPAGTGKTFLFNDIHAIMNGLDIRLEGAATTEAGVRQNIDSCALPVLFDELEGDGVDDKKIEGVQKLMRTAYASETGTFTKGGEDGTPKEYAVRCGFLCFSVLSQLDKETDRSRFLELPLMPLSDEERREVHARRDEFAAILQSPDLTGRLLCRIMTEYPHIQRNIADLKNYLRLTLPARRAELIAHLMAGCYALTHGGTMGTRAKEHAARVAEAYAETEEKTCEELKCLNVILDKTTTYAGITGQTCARLLCGVVNSNDPEKTPEAAAALLSKGMRLRERGGGMVLQIQGSPVHEGIKSLLAGTRWANGKIMSVIGAGSKNGRPNSLGVIIGSAHISGAGKTDKAKALFIPASLVLLADESMEK